MPFQGRFDQLDSEQKKAMKLQLDRVSAQIGILQKSKTKINQQCGGADAPSNMQWQTVADAKAKDKTERACRQ
jgi:hypothetical protein